MIELIKDQLYFNNLLETLKYKLYFKGDKLFLYCSSRLILEDMILFPHMRISVNFGFKMAQYKSGDFLSSFMLADVYDKETNLLNYEVNVPLDFTINDLWMTTKLSTEGASFFGNKYQIFEEQICDEFGALQVANFVDLRMVSAIDKKINEPEMSEAERAQQKYAAYAHGRYKKTYASPLYYSFCGPFNRGLRLMFGAALDSFILENSYIPQFATDPAFKGYLKTDFVKSIKVTLYDDNFSYDAVSEEGSNDFKMDFSNVFNASLETLGFEFTSNLLRCRATISYEEPIQKFLNTVLIPAFHEELQTLYSINSSATTDPGVYGLASSQIKNTLSYGSLILFDQRNNLELISNHTNVISCDQELLGALIEINQKLQFYFKSLIANDAATSSVPLEFQIDFDEMIEVPPKNKYVHVIPAEKTDVGLPGISREKFSQFAEENIFKYFGSTSAQVGPMNYDLTNVSYGYFPAKMLKINDEKFKNSFSFVGTQLTSKEIYDYYNILLKIIEVNSNQEVKLAKKVNLEGVTYEQYLAQESSRQLSSMLDSLVVLARSIDPTSAAAMANVFSTSIDVESEKLPDSLKTNLCLDDNTTAGGAASIDVVELSVTDAFPASLLAPVIAKNIKSINKTDFYNYKSVFSDKGLLQKLNKMPIPLIFAAQAYINGDTLKGFEAPEPVMANFINFALLYLMIKYLFRIQYLDVDSGQFKDLDAASFTSNLGTKNRDLLCRIVPYKNGSLGVSQPKLLRLPIYSRHFVIKR